MTRDLSDEEFFQFVAEPDERPSAPSTLKARIYSALLRRQADSGPLMSLSDVHACGRELCVFEELVRIAPIGEDTKSFNLCSVCHARILGERIENAPIFWDGCPYVQFKRS
jgi:hypothetical protein